MVLNDLPKFKLFVFEKKSPDTVDAIAWELAFQRIEKEFANPHVCMSFNPQAEIVIDMTVDRRKTYSDLPIKMRPSRSREERRGSLVRVKVRPQSELSFVNVCVRR